MKSSGCLKIGFGPLIIDYICIFFYFTPLTPVEFKSLKVCLFNAKGIQMKENTLKFPIKSARIQVNTDTLGREIGPLVRDLKLLKSINWS